MQDVVWGLVIIAIGLFLGGSAFLGHFTLINIFFDGLGLFFIGKGSFALMNQRTEAS